MDLEVHAANALARLNQMLLEKLACACTRMPKPVGTSTPWEVVLFDLKLRDTMKTMTMKTKNVSD